MSIPFFSSDESPFNKCGYAIGQDNKKNFGKIKPIERTIDKSYEEQLINEEQKEQLQTLCSTIRNWLNISMSHKHRFKGLELYESIEQISRLIPELQEAKDHEVLQQLQNNLDKSLAELQIDYEALKQGQGILDQLTDLLYGAKDNKSNRNTLLYKEQVDSQQIQQQVENLLEKSHQDYKTHSTEMRGYLLHFENTYQNWKTQLFTCYDYPIIPNDNNRLELSHSQMKKQYRRITGQKSTAKYLKIHGEQAAFLLAYAYANNSEQDLVELIQKTDYQQLKQQKIKQQIKSQCRARNCATKARLNKTLHNVKELWIKNSKP